MMSAWSALRVKVVKTDRPAPEALGQLLRALVGAVGHQDGSGALVHQVASRLLAHLSRAHDQNLLVFERAEYLPRQLHRDRSNRYRGAANLGLPAHPLGDHKGALQHLVQVAADRPRGARRQVTALYLAQDLGLANHHGVETAGHAEEMAHGILLPVLINMRRQQLGIDVEIVADKVQQVGRVRLLAGEQLDPVAGGENHSLQHPRRLHQGARRLLQLLRPNGQPLAQLDGRGLVVQPQQDDIHGAVNLCTELSWLAAQTLITTRKTRLER